MLLSLALIPPLPRHPSPTPGRGEKSKLNLPLLPVWEKGAGG
jgi:hypothetical protein